MDKKDLAIYIHIPFCVSKCIYCDFLSMPTDDEVKEKYVNSLCSEIKSFENAGKYKIRSVFFGGGTPSILRTDLFVLIMSAIKESFDIADNCEITVECNPGTVNSKKLNIYREYGVNRLSFGVQSANNEELKFIGRIHTYEEFEESLRLARTAGFKNINVDLMSALPGQSLSAWENTLKRIIALNVPHISAYSLIIEEHTPLHAMYEAGTIELPSEDDERKMYYMTKKLLEKAGYKRYEISNYAIEGHECIHNSAYWQRKEYVGFGLGAASLLNNTRMKNTDSLKDYIEGHNEITSEILTEKDRMAEFMFLGLRMMKGIRAMQFKKEFGVDIREVYKEVIDKYANMGMLKDCDGIICLTDDGIDVSNIIFADFILT